MRLRHAVVPLLCSCIILGPAETLAQDAAPSASGGEVGLPALTLDSSVMPVGFALAAEYFVDVDEMAQSYVDAGMVVSLAAFAALGITGYYESYYATGDRDRDIRSYVIAYATPGEVQAGFDFLEDEERSIPASDGTWTDEPGLTGVGETPSEITTASFPGDREPDTASIDITFRVGRFQLGVAGTAYGDGVTSASVDRAALETLAAELEARVTAVQAGAESPGVDERLPSLVPTLGTPFQGEGFVTAADAFGDQVGAVDADAFVAAYERTGSFAADPLRSPAPILGIGVARFVDAGAALDALGYAGDLLPTDLAVERIGADEVDGNPAAGFAYGSGHGSGDADSVRAFVVVDDFLVTAVVEGIVSVEEAEALAFGFVGAAATCITDGMSCGLYAVPADLAVPAATPEAQPTASPAAEDGAD